MLTVFACRHYFTESSSITVSRCLSTRNCWTRRWPWMTLNQSTKSTTTHLSGSGTDVFCLLYWQFEFARSQFLYAFLGCIECIEADYCYRCSWCLSFSLSVTNDPRSASLCGVISGSVCRVCEVIWCSLHQMLLVSGLRSFKVFIIIISSA